MLNAESWSVLWIDERRRRKAVRSLFEQLGVQGYARIEAMGMNMNTAFDLGIRQRCLRIRVVYDFLHVVAKYGREVIDCVCLDEADRLRHDKPARWVIKQARWLLLRNPRNLCYSEQQIHLQDLLNANRMLMAIYPMKT